MLLCGGVGASPGNLFEEVLHEPEFAFKDFGKHFLRFLEDESLGPLRAVDLEPDLCARVAPLPSSGACARVVSKVFQADGPPQRVRRVRVTLVSSGKQVQALNAVVYPSEVSELPVLGMDLILIGGARLLVGMDFSPLSRDAEYLKAYCEEPLGSIREKYAAYEGLLTTPSTKFYGEDPEFFSPAMFFSRADPSCLAPGGPLLGAFDEVCSAYAKILAAPPNAAMLAAPAGGALEAWVQGRHASYDAWHEPRDPAVSMFSRLFGKEWTEKFVDKVLFPWAALAKEQSGLTEP